MSSILSKLINLAGNITGTLGLGNGGTGATTKAGAFDALSPMTSAGDMIYGGTAGTGSKLATGATTGLLHGGNGATPTWSLVVNADVSGSAAIDETKLSFTNSALGGAATSGTLRVRSGTYTPTATATVNMDSNPSASANSMLWMQVGNVVTCSGLLLCDATTSNNNVQFTLTLPVTPASNFTNTFEASGTAGLVTGSNSQYNTAIITATTSAKTVTFDYGGNNNTSNRSCTYCFQYVTN